MFNENNIHEINKFYSAKLKESGANSLDVGWNGNDAQRIRYVQLTKLIDFNSMPSICDYGCGYGFYLTYLQQLDEKWNGCYTGYDISEDMIRAALEVHGSNNKKHTFKAGSEIQEQFDYIVESGIFNLKFGTMDAEWKQYILSTLSGLMNMVKRDLCLML